MKIENSIIQFLGQIFQYSYVTKKKEYLPTWQIEIEGKGNIKFWQDFLFKHTNSARQRSDLINDMNIIYAFHQKILK